MKLLPSCEGSAAVEFAFIAPILALLVGGLIEVGNYVQVAMLVSNAAREGARYASVQSSRPDPATAANNYLSSTLGGRGNVSWQKSSITVTYSPSAGGVGSAATVTVPVTVTLEMPIIQKVFGNQGTLALSGSSTMEVYSKPS
jgi:Flp pilus assembly protein TadG